MWGMYHAWERMNACRVLVGKPEGKKPVERPGRRWRIILSLILKESDRML
jgi:hypothetical protein